MAREVESLVLLMSADIRRMEKQLQQGQRTFDRTADAIERRQRTLDKNLANLGREAGNFAQPIQLAATVALGAITAFSYQAAKRAEAVSGAFEQTFRDMPHEAAAAVEAISTEFGRLETDIKDNFTQLRSVVTALGVDSAQSLQIVDQLQRRALDIAAFRDVSDAEAFRAVISGITGETEPLKRFGVVVNETAVKAELLALGFKGNAAEASQAAKVIARANIIMRQSAEMHGQVSREADTLAEKEKRARAEFVKAAEDLGQKFLPVAAKLIDWATDALDAFNKLPEGVQTAGLALLALVAASGPIAAAIKGLQALIGAAVAARAALAAVGGSGAVGSAGKGAAAGGAAGAAARTAPLAAAGAAVGLGTASFAPAPPRDNAPVEERLAFARRNNWGATAIRRLEAEKAQKDQLRSGLHEIAYGTPEQQAQRAASAFGDFGLSDAQAMGSGAGGGSNRGGGSRRSSADRTPELRAALELELAIAQARATGDTAAIRAAEEREELARLVQQYEAAGYTDAQSRATEHLGLINQATALAEEREAAEKAVDLILEGRERQLQRQADYAQTLNDQVADRLGYEAELARLGGNEVMIRDAERRLFIHERALEILRLQLAVTKEQAAAMAGAEWEELDRTEAGADMARGIVDVLRSDDIWEEAGRRFKDAAWDGVEQLLTQIFSQMGSGKGGGGDWINAIASFFSGRGRATGGGVVGGQSYLVGERRPEVFVPHTSGTILPSVNAAMSQAQRVGGGKQDIRVSINLEGANGDETIRQIAYEAAAQGTMVAIGASRAATTTAQRRQRQRFV